MPTAWIYVIVGHHSFPLHSDMDSQCSPKNNSFRICCVHHFFYWAECQITIHGKCTINMLYSSYISSFFIIHHQNTRFDHKNYSPKRALAVSGFLPDMLGTFRLPEMFLLRSREFSTTEVELNPMASAERIGSMGKSEICFSNSFALLLDLAKCKEYWKNGLFLEWVSRDAYSSKVNCPVNDVTFYQTFHKDRYDFCRQYKHLFTNLHVLF